MMRKQGAVMFNGALILLVLGLFLPRAYGVERDLLFGDGGQITIGKDLAYGDSLYLIDAKLVHLSDYVDWFDIGKLEANSYDVSGVWLSRQFLLEGHGRFSCGWTGLLPMRRQLNLFVRTCTEDGRDGKSQIFKMTTEMTMDSSRKPITTEKLRSIRTEGNLVYVNHSKQPDATTFQVFDEGFNQLELKIPVQVNPYFSVLDARARMLSVVPTAEPSAVVLRRFDAQGSLDQTFGGNGEVVLRPSMRPDEVMLKCGFLAIDLQGRSLVSMYSLAEGGRSQDYRAKLARLLPDGSLDPTFGNGGYMDLPELTLVQEFHFDPRSEKILMVQWEGSLRHRTIALIDSQTGLDAGFGSDGIYELEPSFFIRGRLVIDPLRRAFYAVQYSEQEATAAAGVKAAIVRYVY